MMIPTPPIEVGPVQGGTPWGQDLGRVRRGKFLDPPPCREWQAGLGSHQLVSHKLNLGLQRLMMGLESRLLVVVSADCGCGALGGWRVSSLYCLFAGLL
jgi:hypothetical protein